MRGFIYHSSSKASNLAIEMLKNTNSFKSINDLIKVAKRNENMNVKL